LRSCQTHAIAVVLRRLGIALLVATTCLTAGGARAFATASSSAVTLRIWYGTDDPTEAPLAQSLVAQFQHSHPGVRVALSVFGLDDINTTLQLAMSAGTPPDLVYTTPRGPGLPAYVRAGKLLDLTAVAAREHWAAQLPSGMLAAYNDALAPTGSAGGHVYAAPMIVAAVGVLYNEELFRQLHLAVPYSIAEFEAICAKVKAAGLIPIGFGNADGWVGDDWYLTLVNARTGPGPLLPELHLDPRFSFSNPAFESAASTLLEWDDDGYFTPQFGGLDAQDSVVTFFDGKTAMQLISSTEDGQITALAQQTGIPIGVFAFPNANRQQAPVVPESGYAGWAIPRDGRQPALAEAFIGDMLSDSTAQALTAHGLLAAHALASRSSSGQSPLERGYIAALRDATPGVYLDGAPVPNLNATMEANIQLLLQHFETPSFLTRALQLVYSSHGANASATRTDGEF